ncbi:2796_t:CDS:2 [Ambispora leptoticha]|uniref:2796_t:CDS:1 n=1 Tax=Ambispora leptoticha TaxID=144679 RepID=A0A9N9FW72_9GLOM|nr:2796_t:CDS:2 [Ambispora leptoticha]
MGIPGFFRWLASHYLAVVKRVAHGAKQSADLLYLDINALFHTANIKKKGISSSLPASEEITVANEDAMTIEVAGTEVVNKDGELPREVQAFFCLVNRSPLRLNLQIIFSDSSLAGEGEHKLFQFLKTQRMQSGYNPQLRHVVCDGDADFIIYSLMTHEPHLRILRPGMGKDLNILHVAKLRKHLINDMMRHQCLLPIKIILIERFFMNINVARQ